MLPAGEESHEVGDGRPARPGGGGGSGWRACSRTSRWRAHQRPSGSSMAEPCGLQPGQAGARPGRGHRCAPGSSPPAAAPRPPARSTVTGPGHLEMAAHALGQARRRRRQSVDELTMASAIAGARWPPSAPDEPARPSASELVEPGLPVRHRPAQDQREQEVVQLVGVARPGPDLVEHLGHGVAGRAGRARSAGDRGARWGRSVRGRGAPPPPGCAAPRAGRRRGR